MKKIFAFLLVCLFLCVGCAEAISGYPKDLTHMQGKSYDQKAVMCMRATNPRLQELSKRISEKIVSPQLGAWQHFIQRELKIRNNSDWDQVVKNKLRFGEIWVGMTQTQLVASLGRPRDINRTVNKFGASDQYVYSHVQALPKRDYYVYLDNAIVASWQEF